MARCRGLSAPALQRAWTSSGGGPRGFSIRVTKYSVIRTVILQPACFTFSFILWQSLQFTIAYGVCMYSVRILHKQSMDSSRQLLCHNVRPSRAQTCSRAYLFVDCHSN